MYFYCTVVQIKRLDTLVKFSQQIGNRLSATKSGQVANHLTLEFNVEIPL